MRHNAIALLGGSPAFARLVGNDRPWFPSRDRVQAALAGILGRQWYTNQGPLAKELEARLQTLLSVGHAICVANGTIGLIMAAEAQGLKGKVLVPATARPAALESLAWTGLEPVFADADPVGLCTSARDFLAAAARAGSGLAGMLATIPWGLANDLPGLTCCADSADLPMWFDASDVLTATAAPELSLGKVGFCAVLSFGPRRMVTATEGGCLLTDDDDLAARLRNIRSSYGAGPPVPVVRTSNGRMSEFQAAVALLSLDDRERNRNHLTQLLSAYREALAGIAGLRLILPADPAAGCAAIIAVDEAAFGLSRDRLLHALHAENIVTSRLLKPRPNRPVAMPSDIGLPGVATIAASTLVLPVGAALSPADAERIARTIQRIAEAAPRLPAGN